MAKTTIYEVRGTYPDMNLRYFPHKGKAEAFAKSGQDRVLNELEVELNREGVAKLCNRLFEFIDDPIGYDPQLD